MNHFAERELFVVKIHGKQPLVLFAQKFSRKTLTVTQQENNKAVAASLVHLSVNYGLIFDIRPDFFPGTGFQGE